MRLNKFLAQAGIASRRKCDELIKSGAISVNENKVTEMGYIVDEKKDKVCVNGEPVVSSQYVYYKLNKPKGYICSASDEKGRKTIYDLIEEKDVRLFSVGRLDYNTEGLIILTNDGDFAEKIAHPSRHTEKEYRVSIEGQIFESELAVLRKGVVIDGDKLPAAKVKYISFIDKVTKLSIIIDEGQNRQIRRMFEGIGREIILLKRVRIGNVLLGGLGRGKYKPLTQEEFISLERGK